jgi:lipopolysaccharide heptosyltransferase I
MNFQRTLIIKPSSMGDIVQALPVLTALKESHPEARVSWLVARAFAEILEGHPRVDEVIVFDRHRIGRMSHSLGAAREFFTLLETLRKRQFTTALDLQGLFRSGFFAAATGAPSRVGFHSAREFAPLFYTDVVRLPSDEMHAVDRYLAMAQHVGLGLPKATDHLPVPALSRAAARAHLAQEGLAPGEPFVAVCAHARWETKQWPPERFAEVLLALHAATGARAVLFGGEPAEAIGRRIAAAAAAAQPVDLTHRTTLRELVALIAEARAIVTNDSGPMHVAAAVGTPVVAVFGPTNPVRTGPYGPGHRVIAGRAPCSPCYRRECPYKGGPQALCCLKNIASEEVARLLLETWAAGG